MIYTCQSCRHTTTHRLTYDADTGFLSCNDCHVATEEVQVSDNQPRNTTFMLHNGTMVVLHRPGTHDPYRLYRAIDSIEIGYADNLHDIIVLADQYLAAMGA